MKTRNIFLKTKKFYPMFFLVGIFFGFLIGFHCSNFLNYAKYQKEIQEFRKTKTAECLVKKKIKELSAIN
jgi:uncharacterized membrane protein